MASLLCPTPCTLKNNSRIASACFSPLKLASRTNLCIFTSRFKRNATRCSAFFGNVQEVLVENNLHLDQFPVFQYGFLQYQRATEELSEMQKWGFLVFAGVTWVYLTARPGVLVGAIDAYLLAPLQLGLDSLSGKRNLKTSDFVIGKKLGEGSFGVVYSGAVVPKNVAAERKVQKRGRKNDLELDERVKEKVILKKIKVGIQGAEECGDFEVWFNYRLSRAAPETCAEFLGSFVADKTNSQFTKGGKWLVWKFEVRFYSTEALPDNWESL